MRPRTSLLAVLLIAAAPSLAADQPSSAKQGPPAWAYPMLPNANPQAPLPSTPTPAPSDPDPTPIIVPNSKVTFTKAQIRDLANVPDWHPDNHPPAPDVVLHGAGLGVPACGFCHLPNGLGRPENASLAGLPEAYILQQIADMKNGSRHSAQPLMGPPRLMATIAKLANDEDVRIAAAYFAKLKLKPWIRVVETATVPKSKVAGAMYVAIEGDEKELLGTRILEVPEDTRRAEARDSESGFIAYVPLRSVARGEIIAMHGVLSKNKGKVTPCVACHGADLRGLGPVPALAGRSPSYLVRQLYDLQHGTRAGLWSALMKNAVENMDEADMVAIAAYAASREP